MGCMYSNPLYNIEDFNFIDAIKNFIQFGAIVQLNGVNKGWWECGEIRNRA